MFFCQYDTTTGNVELFINTPIPEIYKDYVQNVPAGKGVILLPDGSKDYWIDVVPDPHVPVAKVAHPYSVDKTTLTADNVDEVTISNVFNPSTVTWPDGQVDTVTDGEVVFSVDLVGQYDITIEAVPYLTGVITLEATT